MNDQRLIVEGKEASTIATILAKRGLGYPKGYNKRNFKTDFVKEAGGINQVKKILREELRSPNVTNIGIIVDADWKEEAGVEKRLQSLQSIIEQELGKIPPIQLTPTGYILPATLDNPQIGIWVMPNNQDEGYFEHFMAQLIPEKHPRWAFANEKIEELMQQTFNDKVSEIRKGKALIYTYLAWSKTPDVSIGMAVNKGYFDYQSPLTENLHQWMQNTFVFE